MVTVILKVVEMTLLKYLIKGENPSRKQGNWLQITGTLFYIKLITLLSLKHLLPRIVVAV